MKKDKNEKYDADSLGDEEGKVGDEEATTPVETKPGQKPEDAEKAADEAKAKAKKEANAKKDEEKKS